MKEYLLDTNALLRFFLNDVVSQARQINVLFRQAKRGDCKIQIHSVIIAEAVFVLLKGYGVSRSMLSEKFLALLSIPYISIEHRTVLEGVFTLLPSVSVSFVDLFLLSEAKQTGKTLVTFDKKLKRLALL